MAENRKLKVFLCHSSGDKPKVRELCHRLISDGFDAWLDEEKLLPGQDWAMEIPKAVRDSDVVIICLSTTSITKEGYVQKEIRTALDVADEKPDGTIFLIPARLEECAVPERLKKWHWVDFFEADGYNKTKASLIERMKMLNISSAVKTFEFEPQMVFVPEGHFLMGSRKRRPKEFIEKAPDKEWGISEKPQHEVELSGYWISKNPITHIEYSAFVNDINYTPPKHWENGICLPEWMDLPIINISWHDANTYCMWLRTKTQEKYRLPTEAEWEKAARGTDGRIWPWGNEFDITKCNCAEAGNLRITPVGKFSPHGDSPYGCSDMVGNVWEFCEDEYNEKEYEKRFGKTISITQGLSEIVPILGLFEEAHEKSHYGIHVVVSEAE